MVMYKKESVLPDNIAMAFKGFYKASYNKFYFDELYLFVTKSIIFKRVSAPVAWFDRHVVDATMNAVAAVTNLVSARIKGFQSGQLQQYAYVFISGVILLALAFIYLWTY